jgi:hypothetical protein
MNHGWGGLPGERAKQSQWRASFKLEVSSVKRTELEDGRLAGDFELHTSNRRGQAYEQTQWARGVPGAPMFHRSGPLPILRNEPKWQ